VPCAPARYRWLGPRFSITLRTIHGKLSALREEFPRVASAIQLSPSTATVSCSGHGTLTLFNLIQLKLGPESRNGSEQFIVDRVRKEQSASSPVRAQIGVSIAVDPGRAAHGRNIEKPAVLEKIAKAPGLSRARSSAVKRDLNCVPNDIIGNAAAHHANLLQTAAHHGYYALGFQSRNFSKCYRNQSLPPSAERKPGPRGAHY